ncbi:siderophore-interacting protein [Streptomyces paludis]|uniref:Siderophore-interacting protein n=1 Tax=Streptomyces paludis TaxID=2282738 RepID=A0A345HIB4_9ACTN|nr:siderophore-interacting protein [Streptomyces paludis]AXG76438.1 siderophore-interacting protein [Streptomyces paludis]
MTDKDRTAHTEPAERAENTGRAEPSGPVEHTDTPGTGHQAATLPVRTVEVTGVARISPRMTRVTFGGPDLADLATAGPDQQVKLYFPRPGQRVPQLPATDGDVMSWYGAFLAIPEAERPWARSYTIRAHDRARGTIDIDFVLHDEEAPAAGDTGPATRWARTAAPGDVLGMFGPSAYFATPVPVGTADWMLLAGDETALPAIGTLIEALPEGARALAWIEVADAAEEQRFVTAGEVTVRWLHRGPAPSSPSDCTDSTDGPGHPGAPLLAAVRGAVFPGGSALAWLAGEASTVRALRRHLVEERGFDKRSVHFSGYWRHALTQDDAPTEADLAEARERSEGA